MHSAGETGRERERAVAEMSILDWLRRRDGGGDVDAGGSVATVDGHSEPTPATEDPATALVPQGREVEPDLSADEFAEYRKVAAAIGLEDTGTMFDERMKHCLAANGLSTYEPGDVWRFLNRKLGKGKWQWMVLRQVDVAHLGGWEWEVGGNGVVPFGYEQYGGKVPLPVLLTVQHILADVPDAHFYVSGVPGVDDDPFLLVTNRIGGDFIVERWDEPDFREK